MDIACAYEIKTQGSGSKDPDMDDLEHGERIRGIVLEDAAADGGTAAGHDIQVARDASQKPSLQRGASSAGCCNTPKGSVCNVSDQMHTAAVAVSADSSLSLRHDSVESLEADPQSCRHDCDSS